MRYDDMKKRSTFSIILPVYNVEKYLKACLDSIYNQTFQDFEIIAVNDGSTDGSLDILNDYCNKYGKMVVVSQDNRGLSAARNVGLLHAKGEYICYVDSDDVIFSSMLEKVYFHFDNMVEIVAYNHIHVDEKFELCDFHTPILTESRILTLTLRTLFPSTETQALTFSTPTPVPALCLTR